MGFGDWIGRAWYDVKDFFSRSEAEEAVREYNRLIAEIENSIEEIDKWLRYFERAMKEIHRGWLGREDDSYGKVVDVFEDKRLIHYRRYDDILTELFMAKDELNNRLQQAKDIKLHLQGLCQQEDEAMKNIGKEELTYE